MSHKVLVVDDSGVMRKIITVALNSCQVTDVLEAGDGKQAWKIFQKHKFDLIVSDWNMPNMTGIELLRTVRGSVLPSISAGTTEAEKSRVLEAIEAQVSDYLVKPFERDDLRTKLEKLIGLSA